MLPPCCRSSASHSSPHPSPPPPLAPPPGAAGQWATVKATIKVGVDYLAGCLLSDSAGTRYVGLIGDPAFEYTWWGRPEDLPPSYVARRGQTTDVGGAAWVWDLDTQGATDLLNMVSAALSAASILFRPSNLFCPELRDGGAYANELLAKADLLREKAALELEPGLYSKSHAAYLAGPDTLYELYPSYEGRDNKMWAAAWAYKAHVAKGEALPALLEEAFAAWSDRGGWADVAVNWAATDAAAVQVLLGIGPSVHGYDEYVDYMDQEFLDAWVNAQPAFEDTEVVTSSLGLRMLWWSKWGNLALSSNAALVAALRARQLALGSPERTATVAFAKTQIGAAMLRPCNAAAAPCGARRAQLAPCVSCALTTSLPISLPPPLQTMPWASTAAPTSSALAATTPPRSTTGPPPAPSAPPPAAGPNSTRPRPIRSSCWARWWAAPAAATSATTVPPTTTPTTTCGATL